MTARAARWVAIVNPASGGARSAKQWPVLERQLRQRDIAVEIVRTTLAGDGERLAREAVRSGHRHLLVAGGDGSAHDVVNGIMNAGLPADDRVTIALAPMGTGNDWARGLSLPKRPAEIAATLATGIARAHDVGRLECVSDDPHRSASRWFVNVAGAGFDAFVLERLPQPVRSSPAYLAGLLSGLFRYRPAVFTVDPAPGGPLCDRLLVTFLAIGRYCGGGMHVAPQARSDDGMLDVVAIRHPGVTGVLRRLGKLYDGRLLHDPLVAHLLSDRVTISADVAQPVEADGQLVGRTPCTASVVARAINVLVPAP